MSGKTLSWSIHFDIRISVPMFYLKLCNHIHIYIYISEWLMKKTITTITVFLVPRGVEKERFQQSASTHSGAGEKETLNINVVGKIAVIFFKAYSHPTEKRT